MPKSSVKRKSRLCLAAIVAASAFVFPAAANADPVECEPNSFDISWGFFGKPTTMRDGEFFTEIYKNGGDTPQPFTITRTTTKNFGATASAEVQFGLSSTLNASGDAIVAQVAKDLTFELSATLGIELSYSEEGSWSSTYGPIMVPPGETYIFRRGIGVQTFRKLTTEYDMYCNKTEEAQFLNLGVKVTYVGTVGGADILDPTAIRGGMGLLGKLAEIVPGMGDGGGPTHYVGPADGGIVSSSGGSGGGSGGSGPKAEPALVRDNGDDAMKIWRWSSSGSSFNRTSDLPVRHLPPGCCRRPHRKRRR